MTTRLAPLAVDLDGTLIRADSLHEGLIDVLKFRPLKVLSLLRALGAGKAAFKREVVRHVRFTAASLPYNTELLAYLRAQKATGRIIGLFTAADQKVADDVAAYVGLFDMACGSDGVRNLSGAAKAACIAQRLGPDFAYAGDGDVDQPIFARAKSVVLVGKVDRLKNRLPTGVVVEAGFPQPGSNLLVWARALRLQHWAKNVLVFLVAFLSPPSAVAIGQVLLLWVLMGVLASATYIINDLFDLAADRKHPNKRHRPFASGAIPVRDGAVVAAIMIVGTLLASLVLPWLCTAMLLAYLVVTLTYSVKLKHIPMVDVTVLAGLFTLRVLAGASPMRTAISPWLLTFSMLFFFGLAIIKRYAELERLVRAGEVTARARGYTEQDIPILLTSGVASGFSAIVIFMVYMINEQYPRSVYAHPGTLWAIMPVLLIWTLRLWHLAVHGRMSEDPVVFALKDRVSWALGATVAIILVAARL